MMNFISEFTKPRLDYIVANANFTEIERQLFELRSQNISHENCAEILNMADSTEYRIYRKMTRKVKQLM